MTSAGWQLFCYALALVATIACVVQQVRERDPLFSFVALVGMFTWAALLRLAVRRWRRERKS